MELISEDVKRKKKLIQDLDQEQLQKRSTEKGFEFRFNPPGAPHMGGVFESLIKSAKRAIRATLRCGVY